MRMWMVDPRGMCRKHLLGEHVELHMLRGCLVRGKSIAGFIANNCVEPHAMVKRHAALAKEMQCRGYKHTSPLKPISTQKYASVKVDAAASLKDLAHRCAGCKIGLQML